MIRVLLCLVWLSIDYLPTLDGTAAQGPNGPVQIIVPSYRFTCPGTLISVTVRVHGNETGNNTLYAQIWRPLDVSAGSYSLVWAGSYPDQELTVLRNSRFGDNVTFFTKLTSGFPLLPNDVVGLLATGPPGFQLAYVTSPGGVSVQTTPNQRSCNLPLCGTLVTQGVAPALTVEMKNGTVDDAVRSSYASAVTRFCTSGVDIPCPSTSVLQGPPTPVATPTPMATPTYQSTLRPSSTMTSSNTVASFPVAVVASIPSAFFVVMITVLLVLVMVLCSKRRRAVTNGVVCVASSDAGRDRLSGSAIGGYSRDHTPNGHDGVQLRHVGPPPSDGMRDNLPHHYSILEMDDFNLIPTSPSPSSPPASLAPPCSSPSSQLPPPTSPTDAVRLTTPTDAVRLTTPTASPSKAGDEPTSSNLDQPTTIVSGYEVMPGYCHHNTTRNHGDISTQGFFEQAHIYWPPANSESGLYSQLNENMYSELPRSSVRLLTPLGSGNFGEVFLGEYTSSEGCVTSQVAVKTVKAGALDVEKVKLLQEAAIMGQFAHQNVVRLVGMVTTGEPLMVVLEYMPKGDLCSFLHKINPRRNRSVVLTPSLPSQFIKFARDIACGMAYLSKRGFVHRDLAARNILLTDDLMCKIGDFGMARDIEFENEYYVSHGGAIPVKWSAPEALNHRKYTSASDVWSYGMVLFEIWSLGEKPFSELTNPIAIALITSKHCQPPPPGCPRALYHLMIQCWNPEHSCRPTFDSIHDYLDTDEDSLLQWRPEDMLKNKQAHVLGVAMSESLNLYPDLQRTYQQPSQAH